MTTISHLLALSSVLFGVWFAGSVIYRLFFHPLAKYPGPFLAKITSWYEFTRAADGDHHVWLYEMHKKYGSVVRVAPNRLSYNTVEALHSIYSDRKANIRKAGFTESISTLQGGSRNLQTINDLHAYGPRRRLIAHAFSEEALRTSEPFVVKRVEDWCRIIGSKAGGAAGWTTPLDMKVWANLLTEDILGELCFGESFGACAKGVSDFGDMATDGAKQAQQLCWMPIPDVFLRLLSSIAVYGEEQKWKVFGPQIRYKARIGAMISRRMELTEGSRKDMFHYIIQAKDPETGAIISPNTVIVEAGVLFGAGVDTSATTIAACLFYLTRYPEVLAKVTAEVRNAFSSVDEVVYGATLRSLVYLRGCIDETLRISPPVPGPLLREVTAGGAMIHDEYIPASTEVSVPSYAIHHNEEYFPDSWTFKPERWLVDSLASRKDAFHAFSAGQRVCIGRNLAYLDMTLALGRLLFMYDIRKAPEEKSPEKAEDGMTPMIEDKGTVEYKLKDWFITGRDGPMVQFRAKA